MPQATCLEGQTTAFATPGSDWQEESPIARARVTEREPTLAKAVGVAQSIVGGALSGRPPTLATAARPLAAPATSAFPVPVRPEPRRFQPVSFVGMSRGQVLFQVRQAAQSHP